MKKLLASLILILVVFSAQAQAPFTPFSKTYQISVSNTASTAVQILPNNSSASNCTNYLLANTGGIDAWVEFGTVDSVAPVVPAPGAPTAAYLVKAGTSVVVPSVNKAYISTITAASTTTMNVSCGQGLLAGVTGANAATGTSSTQVQGSGADGAATTGNPVLVAGTDGTNAQTVSVDTGGRLQVEISDGTDTGLVTAAGEQNVIATAQPGVDIGDVTVNNPAGASAVNVQDGGNSITVDGTVTANAGTGPFPVSDNAGSLTVDAPVATPVNVQVGNGTLTTSVRDTGASDSLNVAVVDASGNQVTSFGGTQYAEDTPHVTGDFGLQFLAVRNQTDTIFAGADGDYSPVSVNARGVVFVGLNATSSALTDDTTNGPTVAVDHLGSAKLYSPSLDYLYDGATWDRKRSTSIGNNVASTGIGADAPYGQYLGNATQPVITTGNYAAAQLDPAGNLRTAPQRPTATDILYGYASATADVASTALVTVSAGRTWVGEVCASVHLTKAAAAATGGEIIATFLTAGTGVVPAAGTYFGVNAGAGANAATGTVGTQGGDSNCSKWTVVAPAGNTVTVNYAVDCNNHTTCRADVSANGIMQ